MRIVYDDSEITSAGGREELGVASVALRNAMQRIDGTRYTTVAARDRQGDEDVTLSVHGSPESGFVVSLVRVNERTREVSERWMLVDGSARGTRTVRVWGTSTPLPARWFANRKAAQRVAMAYADGQLPGDVEWEDAQ